MLLGSLIFLILVMALLLSVDRWVLGGSEVQVVREVPRGLEYRHSSIHDLLRFDGHPVAVDVASDTIYLSCQPDRFGKAEEIAAQFSILQHKATLYYVDSGLELQEAVRQGEGGSLLIADEDGRYMQYEIVLTPLPVVSIRAESQQMAPAELLVHGGEFLVWDPTASPSGLGEYFQYAAQWHLRGRGTRNVEKSPWKIRLNKLNGGPLKVPLFGIPSGAHWILNPLYRDNTKVREVLFMRLWDELAGESAWNSPMSQRQYIELIQDGRYSGLYLLQKPVDPQQLELHTGDILVKSSQISVEDPTPVLEILQSSTDDRSTEKLFWSIWNGEDAGAIQPENLMDLDLFIEFSAAFDNMGFFNSFYIFHREGAGWSREILPWDTDMSFGLGRPVIGPDGKLTLPYDYNGAIHADTGRTEMSLLRQMDPELDGKLASRYAQLRQSVLEENHIYEVLTDIEAVTLGSGAWDRDMARWENRFNEEDTIENLHRFIHERLLWLDTKYGYAP